MQQRKSFLGKFRSLRRDESGVIIIIAALMFPVLVAFMGLSLDFGLIFHWKRRQQRAVDAACIGAATELWRGNDTATAQAAGHDDAAVNGFDEADSTRNIDVQINIPYDGSSTKVEAVITELEVPTYFLRVVGFTDLGVQSRAACGLANYSTGCVWVLNEDDRSSLKASGNVNFNSSCDVIVDSNHDSAIRVSGGACLNAEYMGTVGDYVNNGNANVGCMGEQEVSTGIATPIYASGLVDPALVNDPMLKYAPVVTDPLDTSLYPYRGTDVAPAAGDILAPGRYYGSMGPVIDPVTGLPVIDPVTGLPVIKTREAITISVADNETVYFQSGVYILDSGMRMVGGNVRVLDNAGLEMTAAMGDGSGISFYVTETDAAADWKFIRINTANVKLYAPATGDWASFLMMDDPLAPDESPGHRIAGDGTSELVGIIYFPNRDLHWAGTSEISSWVMLVVDNLTIAGGAIIPTAGMNDSVIPNPLQTVTLLE